MSPFNVQSLYRTRTTRRLTVTPLIVRDEEFDFPCRARSEFPHGTHDLFPHLRRSEHERQRATRRHAIMSVHQGRVSSVLRRLVA